MQQGRISNAITLKKTCGRICGPAAGCCQELKEKL